MNTNTQTLAALFEALAIKNTAAKTAAITATPDKGEKMPHRQHVTGLARASAAAEVVPLAASLGYRVQSARFGKADAAGNRPLLLTHRIPQTLEQRLTAFRAQKAKALAKRIAARAVKDAADKAALDTLQKAA